jgi:ribonuclease HI
MASLKIFFDGGCRPNPGPMETAVVVRGVAYFGDSLGEGSNSDAEWLAAIDALRVGLSLGMPDVRLLGDSALIVGQANGTRKCRSAELAAHRTNFAALATQFRSVSVRQIGRAQNLAGIALEHRRRWLE